VQQSKLSIFAWTAVLVISVSSTGASRQSQVANARPAGVGIRLDPPVAKKAPRLTEDAIRLEVQEKASKLLQGISPEAVTLSSPEVPEEVINGALLSGVPVGYGSLLRTANTRDPGPRVEGKDPRVIPLNTQPLVERIIGRPNLLPVRFLEAGAVAAKAVARVSIRFTDLPDAGLGTGFMISPTLLMTNNHVIPDKVWGQRLVVHFNYQYALEGQVISPPTEYELDADSFFCTDENLDYTIVRVKSRTVEPSPGTTSAQSRERQAGDEFGYIRLNTNYFYSENQLANVIQHPAGRPKEIGLHENTIVAVHDEVIRYTADTEPGSSGSPVFNNSWRLISLHHSAGEQDKKTGAWLNNEGIRIDKIIQHLKSRKDVSAEIIRELKI